MVFARVILALSGVLFVLVGLAFLFDPVGWAETVDIRLETPLAVTDFRALYGGLDLGLGCFFLWAARDKRLVRGGIWGLVAVFGGLVFGRIWGLMVDAPSGAAIWVLLTIEGLGLVLALVGSRRVTGIPASDG